MLDVRFTLKCDQALCPETFVQELQALIPVGPMPQPSLPPNWNVIPKLGLVCPKHEITIKQAEVQCPQPMASRLS